MDDTPATAIAQESSPERTDAPPPRRRALPWLILVLLICAGVAGWWLWQRYGAATQNANTQIQQLRAQIDTLTHSVRQVRDAADTLRARIDDGNQVDKSERQQILILNQRTQLLADSVANLADKRLSAHDTLALDEAELLLALGGERYVLFHDAATAIAAYQAADTALGGVQDPAFASVRQTIGAEITALRGLPVADPSALTVEITALRASLTQLPSTTPALPPVPESSSRLWRVLGAFVQVHHDADAKKQSGVRNTALARKLADLDLRTAQAALLGRDSGAYRAALDDARMQITAAFDPSAATVAVALKEIDNLTKAELAPPPPSILGTALKDLRNLRATHALRSTNVISPSSAPPATETQK